MSFIRATRISLIKNQILQDMSGKAKTMVWTMRLKNTEVLIQSSYASV